MKHSPKFSVRDESDRFGTQHSALIGMLGERVAHARDVYERRGVAPTRPRHEFEGDLLLPVRTVPVAEGT